MGLVRMGPPEDLILELSAEFAVENFVETGTFEGGTAVWAAEHFKNVLTIEMSEYFYRESLKKYQNLKNINFIFGDSRTELKKIIDRLQKPAIFWLDAHWSGGATYGDHDQCPVLKEIEIINRSAADGFIFIDDARLFTSPPQPPHKIEQWADIVSITDALRSNSPDKYIVIIEDVIVVVPLSAKTIVARYCQNVNARLWKEYGARQSAGNTKKGLELIYADLPAFLKKLIRNVRQTYIIVKNRLR